MLKQSDKGTRKRVNPCGYELIREGSSEVMRINCVACSSIPSIEESALCMMRTIDKLVEVPSVSRVIFNQRKNYVYNDDQTALLVEIANLYSFLTKQKRILSLGILAGVRNSNAKHTNLQYLILNLLRSDPLSSYVETIRLIRDARIELKRLENNNEVDAQKRYISVLEDFAIHLGKTKLIKLVKDKLAGHIIGDRSLYKEIFRAEIMPDFMHTRLMARVPLDGDDIDAYSVGENEVRIFKVPQDIKYLYHVTPPEFKLTEDEQILLNLARSVLTEHKPKEEEFLDPDRMRRTFSNIGKDLLVELAESKRLDISYERIEELAKILVRYTVGFGILEVLLQDPKVQDVVVNGPIGQNPIFIVHQDYDNCATNIWPSQDDGEGWASKLRLVSGRPLDEANPVLDTELLVPGAKARVSAMGRPLSPVGYSYAFRRHRDMPWTLPLFISNRMITPLTAGLVSFLIDGARTMLVAGTRSSGKTSFLGSCLVELMRKYRVITIEDSVTGDATLFVKQGGRIKRTTLGELVDGVIEKDGCWYKLEDCEVSGNFEDIEVLAMNNKGKLNFKRISKFIRHKVNKPLYVITTRTGKSIKVTGDHSLFTLGKQGSIISAKVSDLKEKQYLATPRNLPFTNEEKLSKNVFKNLLNSEKIYLKFRDITTFKKLKFEIKHLGRDYKYSKSMISKWLRSGIIPGKIISDLICLGHNFDKLDVQFKYGANSLNWLLTDTNLDEDFLTFVGLWLADGCYDKNSVLMSVSSNEEKELVYRIAKKFNLNPRLHSDGFSTILNSSSMKFLMRELLDLRGNAYTKRIPEWVFNLSLNQMGYVLKGLFSGDSHVSKKEITMALASHKLLEDIQSLLLSYGIILRIGKLKKDKNYNSSISNLNSWLLFNKHIGFLQNYKQDSLNKLCQKITTHDISDVIPLDINDKLAIKALYAKFNSHDYITRNNALGRRKLSSVLQEIEVEDELITNLGILANSDLFWDQIKEIKKIDNPGENVYDLSVPECESFVANNIVAHNTRELPVETLRKLGYDIQPMKVRSALMTGGTEVGADEGIRTSLRFGDSSLIVGEVRSSVRGNEEVVIVDKGLMKRIQIKDLENKDLKDIFIPTVGFDLKMKLSKLTDFVKHPKRKKLLKIKTRTGREVTVTHDHSLFAPTKNFEIAPIECKDLGVGSQIVIPSHIPCGFNDIVSINVFDYLPEFRVQNFESDVRKAIKVLGWKKATKICGIGSGDIYNYFRTNQKTNIPFNSFTGLMDEADVDYNITDLRVKSGTSLPLPAVIPVSEDFCRFLGYYVSEGYYSLEEKKGGNVIITNSNKEIIEDLSKISNDIFGLSPDSRIVKGLGTSIQHRFSCLPLAKLISRLGCGRICTEKRVPSIVFGLSRQKIASFLRGLYSGDGCFTSSKSSCNCVRYFSTSKKLVEDVSYLLLNFGIVARIREKKQNGLSKRSIWILEFKDREMVETFLDKIGFVGKKTEMVIRKWAHTTSNSVKFDKNILRKHLIKYSRRYRHLFRFLSCSKNYLENIVLDPECEVSDKLKTFALGDFFLDEIKEIKEIELDESEYVYDLSVEPSQNFVGGFGGILLHNTEAKALYEAMRVGALANVVAGTIHGADPYSVYDRVVNDLEVPKTSFKATDIILVCNPVKSPDGLHRWKRVMQVSEVRKHWVNDPLDEKGFVDLLKYDAKTDKLEPTSELINGESEIIKAVAGNVRSWSGNWDAVWDNIVLRSKVKETLVKYAHEAEMPELMEAKFVVDANDQFHRFSDEIMEEVGDIDSKRVFLLWDSWLRREIKKRRILT